MIRVAALVACLLLAACGQRGALYMPDEARAVVVPAEPAANPAPAGTAGSEPDDAERARQQQGAAGNAAGN